MKKGKLRFYPYNINWNYGLLPQTWEDPGHRNQEAGDVFVRRPLLLNLAPQTRPACPAFPMTPACSRVLRVKPSGPW